MQTLAVVEQFDVLEDVLPGLRPCLRSFDDRSAFGEAYIGIFDVKESVESTHKPEQIKDLIAIHYFLTFVLLYSSFNR